MDLLRFMAGSKEFSSVSLSRRRIQELRGTPERAYEELLAICAL